MRYALHADDAPDGRLFDVGVFTQRLADLRGDGGGEAADELLYVLSGTGTLTVGGAEHALRPGGAVYVAAGGGGPGGGGGGAAPPRVAAPRREPAAGHGSLDLDAVDAGTATAGRAFLLGPE